MNVIRYPAWHDEARAMREKGASLEAIADKYDVTTSRARQITGPSWKAYLVFQSASRRTPGKTMSDYSKDASKYIFEQSKDKPVPNTKTRRAATSNRTHVESHFMPAPRDFEVVKKMVEGKVLVGGRITCCRCGKHEDYYNARGSVTPSYLPKEFARLGWSVGKNARHDLCPDDAKFIKRTPATELEAPQQKPEPTQVQVMTPALKPDLAASTVSPNPMIKMTIVNTPKAAEPPITVPTEKPSSPANSSIMASDVAEMGKTEHRIIFAKLNEVYGDEKTGYTGEWDDAKVAIDLGVPKEWIAKVRDEHFGPETNARMMRKAIDDIVRAGEAIERRVVLIDKKIEQMTALDLKISDAAKLASDSLNRFNQLFDSLKTEDAHVEGLIESFNKEVEAFRKMFDELKQ